MTSHDPDHPWLLPVDQHYGVMSLRTADGRAALERQAARDRRQDAADATREHRWSAVLASASKAFAEAGSGMQEVVEAVASSIAEEMGDQCVVRLLSDDGQWIRTVAIHHVDPEALAVLRRVQHVPESVSEGLAGWLIRTGASILMPAVDPEVLAAGIPAAYRPVLDSVPIRSLVAAPLRVQGKIIGLVRAARASSENPYTVDDQILLQDLADRASLAIENARTHAALEEAVRLRDAVLAATAHDLRSPLQGIKLAANVLAIRVRSQGSVEPAQLLDLLGKMDDTTNKMTAFISDLTDLARLQAGGQLELRRAPTDIVYIVRAVIAAQQALTHRHTLALYAPLSELVGDWDAGRLDRVLTNLVENAVKYSLDGGDVTVRVRRETVDFAGYAVVSVQDHGIGIPAEDMPHVFAWFHRADNVAGRVQGTGVGLAMAHEVVQALGGVIAVESREREGTTVTLRLPLGNEGRG